MATGENEHETGPDASRVPPGQRVTTRFPVLHYGRTPGIDPSDWRLRLHGLVGQEKFLTLEEFQALPHVRLDCDIHCVTGWSKLGTTWEGVPGRTVVDLARPTGDANFAMVQAPGGWETNLTLDDLTAEKVLFADTYDGRPLTPTHGFPVRLLVPHLYFWKSAKWVTGLEFTDRDRPGFWEKHGYHMRGDPWREERYRD